VVIDRGVEQAVPAGDWARATAHIEATLRRTMDGAAVAAAVDQLGAICEPVLERGEDDVNELPDEVSGP